MATKALGRGYKLDLKSGKLIKVPTYRDASHKIASRKSKKAKVVRATPR